ncbi:hypothetical protein [Leptospira interrogans]|uniref:hypothetical protein n=1 Tax=Leptospira interrogans TaxID=173 RepID=UPI0007732B33|nr:hypothetical protein [Leptospira interrogans]
MGLIFVTFNRDKRPEQSTALRLQTISNLYDTKVELPYRFDRVKPLITEETRKRIDSSVLVFCISLGSPTKELLSELEYAIKQRKAVVCIHGLKSSKLNFNSINFLKIQFDAKKTNYISVMKQIEKFLRKRIPTDTLNKIYSTLGIALGMLFLSHLE